MLMEIINKWLEDRLPIPARVSILRDYIRIQMLDDGESVKLTVKDNRFYLHDEDGSPICESDFLGDIITEIRKYA